VGKRKDSERRLAGCCSSACRVRPVHPPKTAVWLCLKSQESHLEVRILSWTGSVPPTVASGCGAAFRIRARLRRTLPLLQVVLTRSKYEP
jgi:hypothetical protein